MRPPTILCIDDDTLIRELLTVQLREATNRKSAIISAGDATTGVQLARQHQPEIVLLDLGLPDASGFKVIDTLAQLSPRPRILILTASVPDRVLEKVQHSEVAGLLLKSDTSSTELINAIQAVRAGQKYFSPPVRAAMAAARAEPAHYTKILSKREIELVPLFGYGWSNEQIAARTSISAATVRTHRQNILGKLDLHSTEKLIHWAISKGFTDYRYEPAPAPIPGPAAGRAQQAEPGRRAG
ncbi:MAG: response regulator transcription factor [Opitutae bacterium]